MFGKGGYMDGPGGGITPVNINGTVWLQGDGCKANTCGWDFIVTLYNPKTHEVVGYRYFGLDDPASLVWFGEIGVHEFAYLVKNYVATVNYFKESIMKTFIKTLLVAVTVLFSVFATAKQIKLPSGIKYVNSTDEFYCTEIDGLYCQTKNLFKYKGNRYVFVVEQGGSWCYDNPMSVLNLETWKAQKIEYKDNQLCSGENKPFFEIKNGVPTVGVIDTSGKPVVVAQDKLKI